MQSSLKNIKRALSWARLFFVDAETKGWWISNEGVNGLEPSNIVLYFKSKPNVESGALNSTT